MNDGHDKTTDGAVEFDTRYLDGIRYFNECDFFEAHEVWEDLWTDFEGDSRRFYQGLIQAAVALHHFGNGNTRGARKLNESCRKYLDPFRPWHEGLDLDRFLDDMDRCFAALVAATEDPPVVEIDADTIPKSNCASAPVSPP
ncbi:MAG: DUF309 domain-containing protein [Pirellulales bacterium]